MQSSEESQSSENTVSLATSKPELSTEVITSLDEKSLFLIQQYAERKAVDMFAQLLAQYENQQVETSKIQSIQINFINVQLSNTIQESQVQEIRQDLEVLTKRVSRTEYDLRPENVGRLVAYSGERRSERT